MTETQEERRNKFIEDSRLCRERFEEEASLLRNKFVEDSRLRREEFERPHKK